MQQLIPSDKEEIFGKDISRIVHFLRVGGDRALADLGISHGQFGLMMMLNHMGGVRQNAISEYLVVDKATVARAVRRLMQLGYAERYRDPDDARQYIIRLTDAGQELIPKMKVIEMSLESRLLDGLSLDEERRMRDILRRMGLNAIDSLEAIRNG